jgi:hypothetical protein
VPDDDPERISGGSATYGVAGNGGILRNINRAITLLYGIRNYTRKLSGIEHDMENAGPGERERLLSIYNELAGINNIELDELTLLWANHMKGGELLKRYIKEL